MLEGSEAADFLFAGVATGLLEESDVAVALLEEVFGVGTGMNEGLDAGGFFIPVLGIAFGKVEGLEAVVSVAKVSDVAAF